MAWFQTYSILIIAVTFLNDKKATVLGATGLVVTLRAAPETWYTTHNLEQGVSSDSEQVFYFKCFSVCYSKCNSKVALLFYLEKLVQHVTQPLSNIPILSWSSDTNTPANFLLKMDIQGNKYFHYTN